MTKGRGSFAALYLLGVIANICASFQAPLVLSLASQFGVAPSAIGLVMSAQFIAYLVGGSAVGGLVARTGVRRAAQMGLLIVIITALAASRSTTLEMLAVSNIVQGLGMLIVVVAAQIGVATTSDEITRARRIANWSTAPLIGLASGLLLSAPFADENSWRNAFLALSAIATLLIALTFLLPSDKLGGGTPESGRKSGLRTETAALRVCLAVAFSVTAINGSISSWPTYLSTALGSTPGTIGGISSIAMLAGVAGSLGVGMALGRGWGVRSLLGLITPIGIISATLVFGAFAGFNVIVGGMLFWHLAAGATTALLFSTLPGVLRNPGNLPAATGLLYQFAAIGTMLGAPVYLGLSQWGSASVALTALTCCALIAVALLVPAGRRSVSDPLHA